MKYHKNKQPKSLNWSNKIWGIYEPFWTWFSRFLFPPSSRFLFLPSILYHKRSTRFPKLVRSLSANPASFFALSLLHLNGIFLSTQFYNIYKWSDSPLVFLMLSWYSWFSLCVNPFVPNASFLYPLKTSEKRKVFWCFQGLDKGCIGNKWVK